MLEVNEESLCKSSTLYVFRPKYSDVFANRPKAIPTFGLRIKYLIDKANINIDTICDVTYQNPRLGG